MTDFSYIEKQIEELADAPYMINAECVAVSACPHAETMRQMLEVVRAAQWMKVHVPIGHIGGLTEQSKYMSLRNALAKLEASDG